MKPKKEVNRRFFFKQAALAGASLVTAPQLLSQPFNSSLSDKFDRKPTELPTRKLGPLEVSGLGLGCMNLVSGTYNPTPSKVEMISHLHKAVERGITFFDTAEVYGPYASEALVGEALKPFRNQLTLASKFGFEIENNQRKGRNSRPESIAKVVEGSLQ